MIKTPADKWKLNVIKLRKSCQGILKTSSNIRYVGVINQYGRTISGVIRTGTKPLLSSEHTKNEFFLISNLINMRNDLVKPLGTLDHIMIQHTKVYVVLIQKNNFVYYISFDSNVKNIEKLVLKIKKII